VTALIAAALALGSAILAAVGTVMRHRATRSSGSFGGAWFLGAAISLSAFALQIAALVVGTVLLVQPLIVLSVLFELVVQVLWIKQAPTRRQWIYGGYVTVGVVVFVLFARPVPAVHGRQVWIIDVALLGVLALVLVAFVIARHTTGPASAALYGTVSGSLFGIVAVQISSLSTPFRGLLFVLSTVTLYFCIVTAVGAVAAQQRAFARGHLEASYPAMVASEPVVSMVLSLAVLGEKLASHAVTTYISLAGVAVMIYGVIGLARETARVEKAGPTAVAAVPVETVGRVDPAVDQQ
jgi:hypothetical protein